MSNAEQDQGEVFIQEIERTIEKAIPTKLCTPENRRPLAEAFVEMLGRIVEFTEQFKPMNHAQMAALLYFVDNINLRRLGFDDGTVILAMVEGAKRAARTIRAGGAQ